MSTTVKIDKSRKERMDKFVATLLVDEGIKVTFQEVLGLMVDYSLENKKELLKRLRSLPPLEKDPAWLMLDRPDDWGVKDSSERIDEFLYA